MNQSPKRIFAGIACCGGALAMAVVESDYVLHGSKGDQPDMVRIATNLATSQSSATNFANLEIIPGEAVEPGRIRGEPPMTKATPQAALALQTFKLS
jgi:hypothetical protein